MLSEATVSQLWIWFVFKISETFSNEFHGKLVGGLWWPDELNFSQHVYFITVSLTSAIHIVTEYIGVWFATQFSHKSAFIILLPI